ncbi:MAG: hypothetical protein AUI64_01740 [Acidobacteria bacterium 13_1_40CM_2_64_6]|jgi:hypothetical protein|nr:MAG: hypothetical protein AUH43_01020 [Acidobacteria bacterium 13_1_40CM_65_14]OLD56729.1 MAG: hypothetical protein AUI64_01740 [Acidobacteria bacterium 13_1_40CM_2_64_6]
MAAIIWMAVAVLLIVAVRIKQSRRRRRVSVGSGASGIIYDWLHEDKRRAIEIIVEERAGARDPEDRDGNLPDLTNPKR